VLDGDPAPLPPKGGGALPKFSVHVYCVQTAGWIKIVLGMEIGLSPGDFMIDGDPAPFQKRGGAPSPIFGPSLLWPNVWMHQDATSYGCMPQPRVICVRWRWSIFIVAKRLDGQDGTSHGGRPQTRRLCVRWGPSPLSKKGAESPPQFSAHFYCGQTAGYIKMPVGMEVGLSPGDFVIDGDPASPSKNGAEPSIFGQCLLRLIGCMDQDATW